MGNIRKLGERVEHYERGERGRVVCLAGPDPLALRPRRSGEFGPRASWFLKGERPVSPTLVRSIFSIFQLFFPAGLLFLFLLSPTIEV